MHYYIFMYDADINNNLNNVVKDEYAKKTRWGEILPFIITF